MKEGRGQGLCFPGSPIGLAAGRCAGELGDEFERADADSDDLARGAGGGACDGVAAGEQAGGEDRAGVSSVRGGLGLRRLLAMRRSGEGMGCGGREGVKCQDDACGDATPLGLVICWGAG